MANVNVISSNNVEFFNKVNSLAMEIEKHLSDATGVYFKYERQMDKSHSISMDNMGADNFVGNADFYTLMGAIRFGEKENARKAFKCTSDYIKECFDKVDAYKPCGGICAWHGIYADLWLPLCEAIAILNEKLKPLIEPFFK